MLKRSMVLAVVASAFFITAGLPAYADDRCPPGMFWNGTYCQEGDNEKPPDEDPTTGCHQADPTVSNIPCQFDGYVFVPSQDRYLKPVTADIIDDFRPGGALNSPGSAYYGIWEGEPDEGWIYQWRKIAGVVGGISWGDRGYVWLAEAPGEPPPVDPEEVAETILDGMDFEPVEIGLAPRPLEQDPDSIGVVGAPVWMWVANEGPTTWGPLEESATVGGITVTVTANVDDIVWDMGDGGSETCATPGQAYRVSFGVRDSPTCGYLYEHTSRDEPDTAYAVSATANWSAEWSASTGASGSLDVESLTSTVHARIGERQAIEVG